MAQRFHRKSKQFVSAQNVNSSRDGLAPEIEQTEPKVASLIFEICIAPTICPLKGGLEPIRNPRELWPMAILTATVSAVGRANTVDSPL